MDTYFWTTLGSWKLKKILEETSTPKNPAQTLSSRTCSIGVRQPLLKHHETSWYH